jgi:hypothetical protein
MSTARCGTGIGRATTRHRGSSWAPGVGQRRRRRGNLALNARVQAPNAGIARNKQREHGTPRRLNQVWHTSVKTRDEIRGWCEGGERLKIDKLRPVSRRFRMRLLAPTCVGGDRGVWAAGSIARYLGLGQVKFQLLAARLELDWRLPVKSAAAAFSPQHRCSRWPSWIEPKAAFLFLQTR